MLLKWFFTFLAILWLYRAIAPFFAVKAPPPPRNKTKIQHRDNDDDGDYIDYEELK